MGRRREKTAALLTRFVHGLSRRRWSAVLPLSKSLGYPTPQTSLIFELPNELTLSILSHISPEPQLTGQYARFRVQYGMEIDDYHEQRVRFLLPLSMTCKAMRLRLMPWIWERVECIELAPNWSSEGGAPRKLDTIVGALRADISLTTSVKFMTVSGMWNNSILPKFVKCLGSLPNLHTLEIGRADGDITAPLEKALKHVELPQIKVLILPPVVHPLLRHCHNVEDVVYVVMNMALLTDEFLGSLASNQNSKVKRLTIPLVSSGNPSRYLSAFPRLTELTVLYPRPQDSQSAETDIPPDVVGTARSATLELLGACNSLPDFDTLQIVHFLPNTPSPGYVDWWLRNNGLLPTQQRKQALREQVRGVKGVKDLAIDYLKKPKTRYRGGGGRKETTLRVIELSQ